MLTLWNKIGFVGSVASIVGLLLFFLSSSDYVTQTTNNTVKGIVNNGVIVLPVTESSKEISAKDYLPESIIKSVKLDSIDQSQASSDRILDRSVNGFYFSPNSDNPVLFSGITPFKLENVGATFGADYRLIGEVSNLDKNSATVQIKIKLISMIDNYGNAYEIKSRNGGFIGYAESLNSISQKVVKVENTDKGYLFDHSQDVQIVLNYTKYDVELVGKVIVPDI